MLPEHQETFTSFLKGDKSLIALDFAKIRTAVSIIYPHPVRFYKQSIKNHSIQSQGNLRCPCELERGDDFWLVDGYGISGSDGNFRRDF